MGWHVGNPRDQIDDSRVAVDLVLMETVKAGEKVDDIGGNGLGFC